MLKILDLFYIFSKIKIAEQDNKMLSPWIYNIGNTRRYGPLREPTTSSCRGLWAKQNPIMLFWPILGHFCCSVATLENFNSNLNNFEEKNPKKIQKPEEKEKKKINNPQKNNCYYLRFTI